MNDFYDEYAEDDDLDEGVTPLQPEPYWTPRRIIFTILILLMLIAFLAYSLQGLFIQPQPPVPVLPPTQNLPMI